MQNETRMEHPQNLNLMAIAKDLKTSFQTGLSLSPKSLSETSDALGNKKI